MKGKGSKETRILYFQVLNEEPDGLMELMIFRFFGSLILLVVIFLVCGSTW